MKTDGQKKPSDLKNWLKGQSGLKGAIFVGDLPLAYFKHENDWNGKAATQ